MDPTPKMVSYFHAPTLISILKPEGWTVEQVGEAQFRIFAPPESDFDDYRSTMSYLLAEPEGYGERWFADFIRATGEILRTDYHEFKLLNEERWMPSRLLPAYTRWYEWRDEETELHFSQLQSFMLAGPEALYLINAATLKPLEARYLPVWNAVLRSTRIIPERGGGASLQ